MLKILISYMLGPWGMKLLDFYIANSAIINSIVLIYGVILVFANVNYKKITGDWIVLIEKDKVKNNKKKTYLINWKKEISDHSFFPLISGSTSFIPRKVSLNNLKYLIKKDKKWLKTVEGTKIVEVENEKQGSKHPVEKN